MENYGILKYIKEHFKEMTKHKIISTKKNPTLFDFFSFWVNSVTWPEIHKMFWFG